MQLSTCMQVTHTMTTVCLRGFAHRGITTVVLKPKTLKLNHNKHKHIGTTYIVCLHVVCKLNLNIDDLNKPQKLITQLHINFMSM